MTGRILVYSLLVLTALLAVPAVSHTGTNTWLSLTASSVAFVAMALNQFLATRPKYLEGAFGGLDRIYHLHRHLGIIAVVLILVHYFIEPNFKGKTLTAGLNELAAEVGEIAFYLLVVLIGFSLVKRIPKTKIEVPYHLWRQSHRLMGVAFLMVAFHQFFIKRPFQGTALLADYLNIFAVLGIASFIYTQFIMRFRRKAFEVVSVEKHDAATIIEAKSNSATIKSNPGQFGFMHVNKEGLGEPHPFTIAGRGEGGSVRFAIKPLGDFTSHLRQNIGVGDKVYIEGGYGRFQPNEKVERQVWMAGGIGITPFLAMAESLQNDCAQKICLIHVVNKENETIGADQLRSVTNSTENFTYIAHISSDEGRIDIDKLIEKVPFEIDGAGFWFCGPPPLRLAIEAGMKSKGKKFALVKFELFEFR